MIAALWFLLASCGGDTSSPSNRPFALTIDNTSADTLYNYGIDVDLIPVDSNLRMIYGDEEVPFQFEDRNENGVPDKLFMQLDLVPLTRHSLYAEISNQPRVQASRQVDVLMIDATSGKRMKNFTYSGSGQLKNRGVIFENSWIAYRMLLENPFAFDIIGKTSDELVLGSGDLDLEIGGKWGQDILTESPSLGIGSPAFYDQTEMVRFNSFDSREVDIVSAGPLRVEVHTTVRGIPVRDEVVDVRMITSMQADHQWLEVELELLSSTALNLQFGFGLPKHPEATDFTQGKEHGVHFAYTHGLQSAQGEQLGLALMVPEQYELDHYRDDPHDYFYLATPIDSKVSYRLLAAWVKGRRTIFDEVQFYDFVKAQARQYATDPTVKVDWERSK